MTRLRRTGHGMTLIEMMVALLVGTILSLGIFAVLGAGEGHKRTTTSVNDINQAGSHAMFMLDRLIRGAGSSIGRGGPFGCTLHAAKAGQQVLPATAPMPAPFGAVNTGAPGVFRLAPLLVAPGQTVPSASGKPSDVLLVMGGSAGGHPIQFRGAATAAWLDLPNTLGFAGDDLVLLAEEANPNCMVQQVRTGFTGGVVNTLPLEGTYAAAVVGSAAVDSYSSGATVMNIGNVARGNPPGFWLIGVGDDNTLRSYDLLQTRNAAASRSQAVAEGVFELHALYGVDATDSGTISWVSPSSLAYSVPSLMAGTPLAAELLRSIKAVRIGLILRTPLREKSAVSGPSITLFADLVDVDGAPLAHTRALNAAERLYRYRVIESTIPIRNNLL